MNLQTVERQILTFLVSILKANEQGIAQTAVADIVGFADEYMPSGLLSSVIQLVIGMLQSDGVAAVQQLLDDIAAAIQQHIPAAGLKAEKVSWVDVRNAIETQLGQAGTAIEQQAVQALLTAITTIITSYTAKVAK
jgi:hypothetical protein